MDNIIRQSPRLGVILLDMEGYAAEQQSASPNDTDGLGVLPIGFLDHPGSWGCDTVFMVAKGCTPAESAKASQTASLGIRNAARALDGRVDLITTDCAYTFYATGAFDGVATPTLGSSLALLEFARGFGEVAILSSSSETLVRLMGEPPPGVRLIGLESEPEWSRYQSFTFNMPLLDRQAMGDQVLKRLQEDFAIHGRPDALILECTGLPQFRGAIRSLYQGPIIDVSSLIHHVLDIEQPHGALVELHVKNIQPTVSEPLLRH